MSRASPKRQLANATMSVPAGAVKLQPAPVSHFANAPCAVLLRATRPSAQLESASYQPTASSSYCGSMLWVAYERL
jgi:hypothetical protein